MNSIFAGVLCTFFLLLSFRCDADPIDATEYFLSSPRLLTDDEIENGVKERTLDMTWNVGDGNYFRFVSDHNSVYYEMVFSTFPDCFGSAEKALFESSDDPLRHVYSYRWSGSQEVINGPQELSASTHSNDGAYLVADRRIIPEGKPSAITTEEVARIIRDAQVVFYTGAGLSAAAGVPTMNQLFDLLHIDERNIFGSLKALLTDNLLLAHSVSYFHEACFWNPPTAAHQVLKELAVQKGTQIFTENIDYLHERSGIMPLRIDAPYIKSEVEPSSACAIDFVICIGLSFDDRGFLGWYKEHHPEGKIIAIDLKQPIYLGDEDFLLKGDLQEEVPNLM